MIVEKVQITSFRGILEEQFDVNDITVFQGEMGTGKTSKLLAILFALTGKAPSGLTLDDLTHVSSDFLKVVLTGRAEQQAFMITRTKNRGSPTQTKIEGEPPQGLDERLLIEGREIAKLFTSAPSEVARKVDSLLGFQALSQVLNEISTHYVERRIDKIQEALDRAESTQQTSANMKEAQNELNQLTAQNEQLQQELTVGSPQFREAEEILSQASSMKTRIQELDSKRGMLKNYREQLSRLPGILGKPEEELSELRSRHLGMQRRISFLEAAMQTLESGEKSSLQLKFCPLCGSPVNPAILENFKHYEDEYKSYIARSQELEGLISDAERRTSEAKTYQERSQYLRQLITELESEVKSYEIQELDSAKVEAAERTLEAKSDLELKSREMKIRVDAARKLVESLASIRADDLSKMKTKLANLNEMKQNLETIKTKALDVLKKERLKQLEALRNRFEESFRHIYPYGRFKSVTFDLAEIRGREALTVKANLDGGWLKASQMSTGENVAISFALLHAINHLEKSPIILLDEPEEGLDPKGVEGLAHILRRLRPTTQIIVATRDSRFAELLTIPTENQ